ncbi:MAG: OmpA family protein [Actinobacteria bacterium]|nr:OmpA family protein [Actinomycetota bacterium]
MRLVTTFLIFALATALLVSTGCSPDARLRAYQQQSREQIEGLQTDLQAERSRSESIAGELQAERARLAKIQAESEIQKAKFDELVTEFETLAERAGRSGLLPAQTSAALIQLAKDNPELLSYDPAKGLVRLKSDFTFAPGSDLLTAGAEPVLAALGKICSPDQAGDLQVLIVGHTDDIPIVRPETRAKHPTNWHLSVHRAIAVMEVLKKSMPEQRLAVMGFGQWRPVEPNQPGHRGNPANRRVEIFIVPVDTDVPSGGVK